MHCSGHQTVWERPLEGSINWRFVAGFIYLSQIALPDCVDGSRSPYSVSIATDKSCKRSPMRPGDRLVRNGTRQRIGKRIDIILWTVSNKVVIEGTENDLGRSYHIKLFALPFELLVSQVDEVLEAAELQYLLHPLSLHLLRSLRRHRARALGVRHQRRRPLMLPRSLKIEVFDIPELLLSNGMLASYGFAILSPETSYMITEHIFRVVVVLLPWERLIQKAIEIGLIAGRFRCEGSWLVDPGSEFAVLTIQEPCTA